MKLKKPKHNDIRLSIDDKITFEILWDYLGTLGVDRYNIEKGYRKDFPYLMWDGTSFCRTSSLSRADSIVVNTVGDFMKHFISSGTEEIQLTSEYKATIHPDKVIVGCQTITKEKVEEILKIMNEL
jgi:hypothetical protein